jgi:membrane protein implicated in regulation of membrane protease activity
MKKNKMIHYEVITNQVLGIIFGWFVIFFIYPYLIPLGPAMMATLSSIVFFIVSYMRLYLIRICFKNLEEKKKRRETFEV